MLSPVLKNLFVLKEIGDDHIIIVIHSGGQLLDEKWSLRFLPLTSAEHIRIRHGQPTCPPKKQIF